MLAQVLRPLRGFSSRLLATPIGTKSTADNEQHHVFASGDADFLDLEPASTIQPELFDTFPSEIAADMSAQALRPLRRGLCSRLLDTAIELTGDSQAHHVFPVGQDPLSLEPSGVVSSGSFDRLTGDSPAAPSPALWPTQSFLNGTSGQNSQSPWVNTMYQAPEARYYQAEASNGRPAGGFLLLQPVLMPVFSPFWGMQVCAAALPQQPVPSEAPASMFPAEAIDVVTQQCGGPLSQSMGFADSADWPDAAQSWEVSQPNPTPLPLQQPLQPDDGAKARRHRRTRRGGGAMRKSVVGTVGQLEMGELAHAVTETGEQEGLMAGGSNGSPEGVTDLEARLKVEPLCGEDAGENGNVALVSADQAKDALPPPLQRDTSDGSSGSSNGTVDPILLELEDADDTRRQPALDWVLSSFWPLALTKRGCRIVQKAVDVGTPAYQQQLVEHLHGRVHEALKSPHSNYVLQKFIETMPPERMQFVVEELESQGGLSIARHRFGVRILQRLIEHCHPWQTETLVNEVLQDAASLCRHQYGNFAIQHILQHGSPTQRSLIADVVGADIIRLAKHRIASHVVSCAMVHCPAEDVQRLTHTVLQDAGQLADLSRREYGSFVVREVNRVARLSRT